MEMNSTGERRWAMLAVVFGITLLGLTGALWYWWGVTMDLAGRRMLLLLTISAVVCTALLAAMIGAWWLRAFAESETTVAETRAVVRRARATFLSAIREARIATRGTPADAPPYELVQEVLNEFAALEKQLEAADLTPELLDGIQDQAHELRRARANFISPRAAILHVGKAAVDDMREWGVPQASLQRVTAELVPLLASQQAADARAALRTLLELHDQWDPYASWYNGFMGRTAAALLVILLFAVAAAGAAFREGHLLSSFALAGIGGAALSVLSRLPPLAAYGEATQYLFRIVSRVGTGFAASLIGAGLLATGVISITLPEVGSFGQMVAECSAHPPRRPRPATEAVPAAAAEAATASARTAPQPCGTSQVLILLAIAMILGFSERALATFEDRVFPAGTLVPVPVMRPNDGDGNERQVTLGETEALEKATKRAETTAQQAAAATSAAADAAATTLTAAQTDASKEETTDAAQQTAAATAAAAAATTETAEATSDAARVAEAIATGIPLGEETVPATPKEAQDDSTPTHPGEGGQQQRDDATKGETS